MSNNYIQFYEHYKTRTVNLVSDISTYDNWTNEYCRKEINNLYKMLIVTFKNVDFTQFSVVDLEKLGFQWFDDNLILMPIWAIDCLPIGCEVISINGQKKIVGTDYLDKDTRSGVTAWGFDKASLRDGKINAVLD